MRDDIKFCDELKKFIKNSGIDWRDAIRIMAALVRSYNPEDNTRWKEGKHPLLVCDKNISEDLENKYWEFHDHLVQEVLDFISENPEIIEVSKEIDGERKKDEFDIPSSLDIYFSMTWADESLEKKQWVPSMDSNFEIDYGNQTIMKSL
jgi:hypothetical protein